MKFWEWWIFATGLLCVLSADSSILWCAVLAIACLFGIIMQQFQSKVEEETRKSMAMKKSITSMAVDSDAWVRHCESEPLPSDSITIWDEYQ